MKNISTLVIVFTCILVIGCIGNPPQPVNAYKTSDLYTNQFISYKSNPEADRSSTSTAEDIWEPKVYRDIGVYGKVDHMGDFLCPCFELSSGGGKSIVVWYDGMVDKGGVIRPNVSIKGIKNGDWVVVTGELRIDVKKSMYDFWATSIKKI